VSDVTPAGRPSNGTPPSVAFVCCVEDGALEDQILLLARSIRRFGGTLADAPVYAVAPRAGREPAPSTITALQDLGVTTVVEHLNLEHPDYGMANKWAAGRWAEEHADTDVLVFVDSDTFFCADPTAFRLPDGIDLAVRPVDRKDKGSTGTGDERDAYWLRMYDLTGVTARPWVETSNGQQRIRAYFNGGLVVTRRDQRLFSAWYEDFLALERSGHLPPEGIGYLDQLALGATVARHWERTIVLDWRYDYPLPHRSVLAEPARSAAFEDLVHVHYHRWFGRAGFLDLVLPPFATTSPVRAFIESYLPLRPPVTGLPGPIRAARHAARGERKAAREAQKTARTTKIASARRYFRRLAGRA
jgi:hypothetical protein